MQNHPLMIVGTSNFLKNQPDMLVAGSAKTPEEAFGILPECEPNLLVYELSIVGPFNFSHLRELRRKHPSLPILAFSYHEEVIFARRALEAGASGYLMKEAPPEILAEAIRRVLQGEVFISDRVRKRIERESKAQRGGSENIYLNGAFVNSLTNRELQIFQFLGDGFARERIQEELNLTAKALSTAIYRMRQKLSLKSAAELVQCAFHWAYYEGDFS